MRDAGASGQLTVRADSGFYNHAVVAACRAMDVRFSVTVRQQRNLRTLIEAIPEEDWTPIPYWQDDGAAVAETTYTPFQHTGDATAVRLIVRRVTPTPGSQLALFVDYSYHAVQVHQPRGGDAGLEAAIAARATVTAAQRSLTCSTSRPHSRPSPGLTHPDALSVLAVPRRSRRRSSPADAAPRGLRRGGS